MFRNSSDYKCWVDRDASGCQVWSLNRPLHQPRKEVTKHHNRLFLPDISGYELYSFMVLQTSSLLVRLNPYLLPEQYTSLLFNVWMFKDGTLLLGLHPAFFSWWSHLDCITEGLHAYGNCSSGATCPKPPFCSSNFSRYLATATASCNPCIEHIYNDNLLI